MRPDFPHTMHQNWMPEGLPLALRMYQDMVVCDDECGFRLSSMGRQGFNMLHDGFIEQIQTEGMPGMPVMH